MSSINWDKVVITKSDRDKKFKALFTDSKNKKKKTIHFGAKGMSDFTIHKDKKRKDRYLKRHRPNEDWNNPATAGALSRWILWNKPTFDASLKDFKQKFKLK